MQRQGDGRPAGVLKVGDGEIMLLHVLSHHGEADGVAYLLVAVDCVEVLEGVAKDAFGRGEVARAVFHLVEGNYLEDIAVFFKKEHSGMAATRDTLEWVAHDVVVENPPIAPYFDVGSGDNFGGVGGFAGFFDVDDAVGRDAYFARGVVLAEGVD